MNKEEKYIFKLVNTIVIITMYFINLFTLIYYNLKYYVILNFFVLISVNTCILIMSFLEE